MQDLCLKREKLAREVKVDDPLIWLKKVEAGTLGESIDLCVLEIYETPNTLVCYDGIGGRTIIFSTPSPKDIRRFRRQRKSKILQKSDHNPLYNLPRKSKQSEISILNGGALFDLELPVAWERLTGFDIGEFDRIWIYVFLH